jgi:flagellar biosynthesis/type III secretory pathway protein FliH
LRALIGVWLGRRAMTFTISKRTLAAFGAVLAITLAAVAVGYLAGQSTRKSSEAVALLVNQRVTDANKATNAERDLREVKAIRTAVNKAVKKAKRAQYRKDQKRWKTYSAKLVDKAHEKGYSEGNTAGYSAGNADGFSSGHTAGVDEGIDQASDELICSDDSDVALPACTW